MRIRRRTLDTWLNEVHVGWGARAVRSAVAVSPLVARGRIGDLRTIGLQLANDGHQLEEMLAWFRLLASQSRAFRNLLERGGIINLAGGWADGVLHHQFGIHSVAPFEVLRLRLREQVELANSIGEPPGRHLAFVVIEHSGPAEHTELAARHVRDAFAAGELMAATPSGKLLVLVHPDPELRRRTARLADTLRLDDQLRGSHVRVWIEPLAMTAEHVDSHLAGLAS